MSYTTDLLNFAQIANGMTASHTTNATSLTLISVGNTTVNTTISATSFSGTANNATNFGGVSLSLFQSQISSNGAQAYANAVAYANAAAANAYANAVANVTSYVNSAYAALAGATFTGAVTVSNTLTVTGNLLVTGTTVTINATTLDVKDNNITVAKGTATGGTADGAGLTVDTVNAQIYYNYSSNSWQHNLTLTPSANNTLNLGTATLVWNTVYVSNVVANNISGNGTSITSVNASALGGTTLTTLQSQITGNAATAYSNAVSNAAALYQTTAGLSANVLVLAANAATYLGNSATTGANVASWITGNSATAYTNATTYASNGSNISSGTVAAARLGSGTANSTTILYGNNVWATAPSSVNTAAQYTWTNTQTYSTTVVFTNNQRLQFTPTSGSANVYLNMQSDDNFVFYVTSNTGTARAVYNIYANTSSTAQAGALRLNTGFDINGQGIWANNSLGTSGQVLTSNGSSVAWANSSGGGGSGISQAKATGIALIFRR